MYSSEAILSHPSFANGKTMLTHHGVDVKADNIMLGIEDDSVLTAFEEQEMRDPSPRKLVDGRTIYLTRELQISKGWGAPVLCDFGSAVLGNTEHMEDIQPNIYRAPEVILEAPWSYQVDIWNTGCMVRIRSANVGLEISRADSCLPSVFPRYGTSLREVISSQATIRSVRHTEAKRTFPR